MPDPRGGLLRTKSGCLTCRVRRVKCDETKPFCIRCSKTGRLCDGYSSVPISRRELIARQFPDPNLSAIERKCFEFFRLRTAKVDWDIILQLSHLEPSIRHGVLALGSLHHEFEYNADDSLRAYDKAIQHTRALRDTNKILAACAIFTCFENLNGNYAMANLHLRNGLKIQASTPVEEDIVQLLHRLDFQAMTYPDSQDPYPYGEPEILNLKIPYVFSTAKEARLCMVELDRWAQAIQAAFASHDPSENAVKAREACRTRLREWKTTFDRSKSENWLPMPRMYWMLAMMFISAGCEEHETAWDENMEFFAQIVGIAGPLARIKSFSLEMGSTVPLYLVAIKCRDPRLRRKAVELLKTPRKEGIWYSLSASKVAERVIEMEEGSREILSAQDVPEAARVHNILFEAVPGADWLKARFATMVDGQWRYQEEVIHFEGTASIGSVIGKLGWPR